MRNDRQRVACKEVVSLFMMAKPVKQNVTRCESTQWPCNIARFADCSHTTNAHVGFDAVKL